MARRRKRGGPRAPGSEAELAALVITWLEEDSWDVYQEVDGIDIVAVRGPVLWAIECKTSMGFSVLEQGLRRRAEAHAVWVATPPRRRDSMIAERMCSAVGIGWIQVPASGWVSAQCRPAFNRSASVDRIRKMLRPEHKTYAAAGSPYGSGWTPFKETCRELLKAVRARPGISMKKAVDSIRHHYSSDSSARRTLASRIKDGIVPGVDSRIEGGTICLYPSTDGQVG